MTHREIQLINDALDGALSDADRAEFHRLLLSDAEVRAEYGRQSAMHGLLEWELKHLPKEEPHVASNLQCAPESKIARSWHRHPAVASLTAIAAAVVVSVAGWHFWRSRLAAPVANQSSAQPMLAVSVARITSASEAAWKSAGTAPKLGSWLMPGNYQLVKGRVELTFDSGAKVYLVAPAQIELRTPFSAFLHSGKATAEVPPPAVGFTLETPTAHIKDLGTAFSVNVENAETDLHVLKGVVAANGHLQKGKADLIRANESLRFTDSSATPISISAMNLDSMPQPITSEAGRIPARYVHWSLDNTSPAGLLAETGKHDGSAFPLRRAGSLTAIDLDRDSVMGKFGRAFYFDGNQSYLASDYPGIAGSAARTVAFWVQVPKDTSIPHAYAMISWGVQKTASKWQLGWNPNRSSNDGKQGAIRTEFQDGYVIGSTDLRDGKWHYIASVFLGGSNVDVATHIRQYVDGKLETVSGYRSHLISTKTNVPGAQKTMLGAYTNLGARNVFRGFRGAMSEVYIFDGALTPGQIYDLYKNNRPPQTLVPVQP